MVAGVVREWHDAEGWGVIDSPETPGGCWAHFSHIDADGYRSATPGQTVDLVHESPGQDGYPFRAVRVRIDGLAPAGPAEPTDPGGACSSRLTIRYDGPEQA